MKLTMTPSTLTISPVISTPIGVIEIELGPTES